MTPIIEVKNLGKKYKIGEKQRYLALRDVLTNIFKSPAHWFGSKIKTALGTNNPDEFWALQDINFTVEKGEVLGIIGQNGAGKSTLLKILSQITPPTTGEVKLRGRVGSLLEVGTGFHPELTGRENIYLNGAILGMRKKEIERKFDEIVEFSGIGKFLDTPIKRYSSGMYVRLAFAVAAHLEPEILIIDEVLAVGDTEFQKKCIGKMESVTGKDGRTVLFVSHNMNAVQRLCKRSILLKGGKIVKIGETSQVIDYYLNNEKNHNAVQEFEVPTGKSPYIKRVSVLDEKMKPSNRHPISQPFYIKVDYTFLEPAKDILVSSIFYFGEEIILYSAESDKKQALNNYEAGEYSTIIKIPAYLFNVGIFYFSFGLQNKFGYLDAKNRIGFEIIDVDNAKSQFRNNYLIGPMAANLDFQTDKLN